MSNPEKFSSSDWITYLEIELFHSLEKFNIKEHIENYSENRLNINGYATTHIPEFFEIIKDFYDILIKLRYATSIPGETSPIKYSDGNYNDFMGKKYDE